MSKSKRLPREIMDALNTSGFPWTVDDGKRHLHLRVNGRLVGIFSKGGHEGGDGHKKIAAQIRREVRAMHHATA